MGLLPSGQGGAAPIPPGPSPMPPAFLIPRTVELAAQALPAAGAFTAQAFSAIPAGTKRVAYDITYTGASATGFPAFRVEFDNGVTQPSEMILDGGSLAADATGGAAVANLFVERLQNPSPPGAAVAWVGVLQVDVPDNYTGVRLLVAEAGDTGTPGTVSTAFTGAGGAGA